MFGRGVFRLSRWFVILVMVNICGLRFGGSLGLLLAGCLGSLRVLIRRFLIGLLILI